MKMSRTWASLGVANLLSHYPVQFIRYKKFLFLRFCGILVNTNGSAVIYQWARHSLTILRKCFMYLAADMGLQLFSVRRKNS